METNISNFQLSPEAMKEVEMRLKYLLEACQMFHVPMFASVVTANSEQGTQYNNITYSGPAHNIELADDQIRKHILIANGFDAVPKRDVLSFDPALQLL